jgi:hypothetical protein
MALEIVAHFLPDAEPPIAPRTRSAEKLFSLEDPSYLKVRQRARIDMVKHGASL